MTLIVDDDFDVLPTSWSKTKEIRDRLEKMDHDEAFKKNGMGLSHAMM